MELHHAIAGIWVITLVAAAISDLRSFKISNLFPAIVMLLFALTHGLAGFSTELWAHLFHFLVALVVGMALFSRGWIGGGDAKLYAAVALWFDWTGAPTMIFLTGIAGLFLTIAMIAARKLGLRKNVPKEDRRIPYGVAIASGAMLNALFVGWNAIFPAFSL